MGIPVVIIRTTQNSILAFPAAKHIPDNLKGHKLEKWHKAGLPLNSCVLMVRYDLDENDLIYKMGRLQYSDILSIQSLISALTRH